MHAWSLNNPDTQKEMKDSLLSSCSCQIFGWQRSEKVPSSQQDGHHLLRVCVHACMCVCVCVCVFELVQMCVGGWVHAYLHVFVVFRFVWGMVSVFIVPVRSI